MRKVVLLAAALSLAAAPRDAKEVFRLLAEGTKLTASDADQLEGRLQQKPQDADARIQLLAFYAAKPNAAHRALRSQHILWVLNNDPVERLGVAAVRSGVLHLNCAGDALADRAAFEQARPFWLALVEKDGKHLSDAVKAIQYCDPDRAEKLLLDSGDRRALGAFYAGAAVGIVGVDYQRQEPSGSDPTLRETPLAARARAALENATARAQDALFLRGAAATLCFDGAILWADGKLDWDYSALARPLLQSARNLNPDDLTLWARSAELPPQGERPATMIRIGGNVQQASLTRQPKPSYPTEAKRNGIQGTVRMTVLLGLDGKVLSLRVEKGPVELVESATSAVRLWEYRPTLLNGKPCFVLTTVDVNYTLQQ